MVSRSKSTACGPGVVSTGPTPGGIPERAGSRARAGSGRPAGRGGSGPGIAPLALPAQQLVEGSQLLPVIAEHGLDVVRHQVRPLIHADIEHAKRLRFRSGLLVTASSPEGHGRLIAELEAPPIDAPDTADDDDGEGRRGAGDRWTRPRRDGPEHAATHRRPRGGAEAYRAAAPTRSRSPAKPARVRRPRWPPPAASAISEQRDAGEHAEHGGERPELRPHVAAGRSVPKVAKSATGSATRKKAMPGARTFFIMGMTSTQEQNGV